MEKEILETAAMAIGLTPEEAALHYREVPEIDGYYFWEPGRGGVALLINRNGETLGATSSVSFEKHLQAFLAGRRN